MNTPHHPQGVGLGLRRALMPALIELRPREIRWMEVSPENYVRRGGAMRRGLDALRGDHPLVSHGLTLSLGGDEPLDAGYLADVRGFVREVGSPWHSDHLCMSAHGGAVLHDLLPIPHTPAMAARIAEKLLRARDALGVPMAVENISYYARPGRDAMTEVEFIHEVLTRGDAGLLLDVNNVYVNACNHGFDPEAFIAALPLGRVVQIHVAGHHVEPDGLRIDTHGAPVSDPVHALLAFTLRRTGPVPVLLERDQSIPPLEELLAELRALQDLWDEATAVTPEGGVSAASMLAALCLSRDGGARFDDDPEGFARAAGLDDADAERVAAQRRGVSVYRALVRNNLADTLTRALPRTRDALGEGFEDAMADFLERAPPRTRYLREVPGEFARRLADRSDEVAPWLVDLARFEWAEFDAAHAGGDDDPAEPMSLERGVRLHPSAQVLSLGWRAHEPSADPARNARCELLVHRAGDDDVIVEEITPATRALLAALRDGDTLGDALRGALAEVPPGEQPAALAAAVACVEALETRGVLVGGALMDVQDTPSRDRDHALVESLRAGDEAAFEGFVEAHGAAVMRTVQRHCHATSAWDDAVQEVWITFLGSLERFAGRSSLRTWLLGIAIHQARNHGRREARSVPLSSLARDEATGDAPSVSPDHFRPADDRWAGHWASPPAAWGDLGQTPALARELRERLQRAVDTLPPAQREVVVLRDVEGLDGPEVAEALGITEANARVLLHRGRARVRAEIESYVRGEA